MKYLFYRLTQQLSGMRPLPGSRMSACLHIVTQTANPECTLQTEGAGLVLCASKLLSPQDDVAAGLVSLYHTPGYAVGAELCEVYCQHIQVGFEHEPVMTKGSGADRDKAANDAYHIGNLKNAQQHYPSS